jgi:protein MPE1
MVNADGDFVIAEPDKASWEQFQAKAKSTAAVQKSSSDGNQELQERGLECPIDKRMFIDPMKTPCCEKTYCNDCITNALIESDLVCPGCSTEGVLIDDLKTDEEIAKRMQDYLKGKDTKTEERPKSPVSPKSPAAVDAVTVGSKSRTEQKVPPVKAKSKSPTPPTVSAKSPAPQAPHMSAPPSNSPTLASTDPSGSKKRPAEDPSENPKIPKAPKAMQKQQEAQQNAMMQQMMNNMGMGNPMISMPNLPMNGAFPSMNGFGGLGMPAMPDMNMGMMNGMGMMNPMMGNMQGFGVVNGMNGMNSMNGMSGMSGMNDMSGMNGMNGMNNMNGGFPDIIPMDGANTMWNGGMNGGTMGGGSNGGYQQQTHRQFTHKPADDGDAYFRKPVNPHRHQNRQRRVPRPSDYREL